MSIKFSAFYRFCFFVKLFLDAAKGEITVPVDGWLQGVYIVSVITEGKALQSKLLKE